MWYSSPSTSPNSRVSSNDIVATVETDSRPTEGEPVAEGLSELDFTANAIPDVPRVRAAAAAGPGTEYWLP
jgi:hypothetical protein